MPSDEAQKHFEASLVVTRRIKAGEEGDTGFGSFLRP